MTRTTLILAASAMALTLAAPAFADGDGVPAPYLPEMAEWGPVPPVLPEGAGIAVLSGNPFGEGWYALRLNMPSGYEVPAHYHSNDEMITVVSGEFNIGDGDKLDHTVGTLLNAGGFVEIPAGHPHYAWASAETIVQIHGPGPFDIIYMDPADNPMGQ